MNKHIFKGISIFLSLFLVASTVGCSSGGKSTGDISQNRYSGTDGTSWTSESENIEVGSLEQSKESNDAENPTALTGTGESINAVNNSILSQRKIIRNANISVEVENFDTAYGKIEYIISNVGYVQESKISKVKQYVDSKEILVTNGVITIRVDADKFSSILKDIKGLGLLTDENIKTDDVTDKFFDIESRLRLIRYEESRLEEYLKKIEDPDTIFKTQSRLTDIRHEIEQLTGTLNKLSDLVELSTITINMNEKVPKSTSEPSEPIEPSYLSKLQDNFLGSLSGVIEFLGNLLILIVAAFPVLVLIGIMLLVLYFLNKKFLKNKIKKPEKMPAKTEKNDDNSENNWLSDIKHIKWVGYHHALASSLPFIFFYINRCMYRLNCL